MKTRKWEWWNKRRCYWIS